MRRIGKYVTVRRVMLEVVPAGYSGREALEERMGGDVVDPFTAQPNLGRLIPEPFEVVGTGAHSHVSLCSLAALSESRVSDKAGGIRPLRFGSIEIGNRGGSP